MNLKELQQQAKAVAEKAHAPYSEFRVGCALYTQSGNTYVGCNVENSSYGLTTCAERNAIGNAIAAEGKVAIKQVVVYTPTSKPASPCGVCRQVIYEFCDDDVKVLSICDSSETIDTTIKQLLPEAFDLGEF